MSKQDKLEDYGFDDWVPARTQEMILEFWNQHSGASGWRRDHKVQGLSELAHHGPNPNGFQIPPHGATCEFFLQDWELSKSSGKDVFYIVKGRYVHRWNNMGSLIDANGKDWTVSSCDRWVRVFASEDERDRVLAATGGDIGIGWLSGRAEGILAEMHADSEWCMPYRALGGKTPENVAAIAELKKHDMLEFHRGLMTDDGEVAGAGWCRSEKGNAYVDEFEL